MVQTTTTTKEIDSGQGPPQDTVVAPSRTKKRRGKPGELCQLNLDVLFLLAAYVHPLDLLSLARTCKSLRELLMDKASAFVWKTARRGQVQGLPDCPADMTEPEYANLVFYSRCNGCGKYAKKILWQLRRRYCPQCRDGRFRSLSSCPDIIRPFLPMEKLTINGEKGKWVDKEQLESFIEEYNCSSDEARFLSDKQKQYSTIYMHASECRYWEWDIALNRRDHLAICREERGESIFQRLEQHGYGPEIEHFGHYAIRQPRASFFKTSKPLTDKEWDRMWPDWFETMNDFSYVTSPSSNTPSFDLLPHVIDLGCFPPFRDTIKAPDGTEMGEKPFESAFTQLPVFFDEWRKQLDAELAELVKIPSQLSRKDTSSGRAVSSSSETPMESFQSPTDKLRLACAVFETGHTLTWYPDVLFDMVHRPDPIFGSKPWDREMPVQERFKVICLKAAPYIVHACGLDPNVATVEDMDRRNARLKCLSCNDSYIRNWKGSLFHSTSYSHIIQTSLSKSPHWQVVSAEYMDAIQAAELSALKDTFLASSWCLLCRPRVGDAHPQDVTMRHLVDW
ncbi:hypothetical protein HD554DRAFT_2312480 [Boletus coccyginus]|nr:hypothetical protein HD554DRAFT_2312480 [Boletus coccyginus]